MLYNRVIRYCLFCLAGLVGLASVAMPSDNAAAATAEPAAVESSATVADDDDDESFFEVGGALRLNLVLENYESSIDRSNGYFTLDMWRIDVEAANAGLDFNLEYRFYPTFDTHFIKRGWVGYEPTETTRFQAGITQVPFGNVPFASNSWWFQHGYYVGLEDNFGTGLKMMTEVAGLDLQMAYFLQPAPAGPSSTGASFGLGGDGRYSYDVIPTTQDSRLGNALDGDQSIREMHQGNLRLAAPLGNGSEIGVSAQAGELYNQALDEAELATAYAAHADLNAGRFNVQPQVAYYNYRALNDDGTRSETVPMGAYRSGAYPVAAEGVLYQLSVSYALPVDAGPVSMLTFYNDYAYLDKQNGAFDDTQQNILGLSVTAGDLLVFVDVASGRNHPWLTDSFGTGLGPGAVDPEWNTRFNINIGYYF